MTTALHRTGRGEGEGDRQTERDGETEGGREERETKQTDRAEGADVEGDKETRKERGA